MKKILSFVFFVNAFFSSLFCDIENIVIENKALRFADGKAGMIDRTRYALMCKMYSNLRHFISEKKYVFNSQNFTLKELSDIYSDKSTSKESSELINVEFKKAMAEFQRFSNEYIDESKGTKDFMFSLVKDFCDVASLAESELLRWAKIEDGHEVEEMNKNIKNVFALYKFSNELRCFLKCMLRSCKKAKAQFQEFCKNKK